MHTPPSTVCAVCAERYARGVGYTCSKCDVDRRNLTIGVALVLLGVAVVMGAMSLRYLGSFAKEPASGWIQSRVERSTVSQGLKITIVSWQIVSQVRTHSFSRHAPKFRCTAECRSGEKLLRVTPNDSSVDFARSFPCQLVVSDMGPLSCQTKAFSTTQILHRLPVVL